jgi:hypothetical protein
MMKKIVTLIALLVLSFDVSAQFKDPEPLYTPIEQDKKVGVPLPFKPPVPSRTCGSWTLDCEFIGYVGGLPYYRCDIIVLPPCPGDRLD